MSESASMPTRTTPSAAGSGTAPRAGDKAAATSNAGNPARAASSAGVGAAGSGPRTGAQAGAAGMTTPKQSDAGGASGSGAMAGAGNTAMRSDAGPQDAGAPDAGGSDAGTMNDDLCDVGLDTGQPPIRPKLSGNTGAHDPTMIEADGKYYRFWTGDNTPSATSTDLGNWSNAPGVYRNGYPQWSREWLAGIPGQTFNFPWAPDASYFNGKHNLYVSFSAKFGDNISCITHLTSTDIAAGNWTDHGPVICTKGDEKYNAIDPDVGFDAEGKPYLAFGSFWDGIMAFPLTAEGERIGTELTRLAWAKEIEAPVLFRRCGYHYLFVSHGLCCPGQNRTVDQLTYRVVVGRSKNILGPYVDRDGKNMIDGGGTVLVKGDSTYAAAGHSDVIVSRGHIYQLYHAYKRPNGAAELRVVELLFDKDGWPLPSAP